MFYIVGNKLLEVHQNNETITSKIFDQAWDKAMSSTCSFYAKTSSYTYINKNHENFLNLAGKIFPNLRHENNASTIEPTYISSLPRYPNIAQDEPTNDFSSDSLTISQLLKVIEEAEPEEKRIFNNVASHYEDEHLQKDWLFIGFGLLIEANASEEELELFGQKIFEIEKLGLPQDKFIRGFLEQIYSESDIDSITLWTDRFFDIELEEKRLHETSEENNPETITVSRVLVNVFLHPVSLLIKAVGTAIALIFG